MGYGNDYEVPKTLLVTFNLKCYFLILPPLQEFFLSQQKLSHALWRLAVLECIGKRDFLKLVTSLP